MTGTQLFQNAMEYDYGDKNRAKLMHNVWKDTPYMVDAWTGSTAANRDYEMLEWCYYHFGDQHYPIHGKPGDWQRGGATINGWTWYGFRTAKQLKQFLDHWRDAEWIAKEKTH